VAFLLTLVLAYSLAGLQSPRAQTTTLSPSGAAATADKAQLHQALLDLTNSWTVMCVAAHPDDEDGSTLTVLRRKYGVHTVSLFSTYGEGGQNAVGPELYEELGVIRARETMAAAEVQGSEPHFLGLRDFGFSKSAAEAFRIWGEKEALRRMVLQIRQLRPDVIITNHDTTSGHGHHQATGRLILQAFDAAADPKQFPEQLTQVSTWQPQRLFLRVFAGNQAGAPATIESTQPVVTIDPNERDPVRGVTYAQQALAALQRHATQGPWPRTVSPNGARIIRYNLVRSAQSAPPLPSDAKTPLDGLRLPESIGPRFQTPTIDGKPLTEFVDNRAEVLVALIHARKAGAFTAPKEVVQLDPQRFGLMSSRLDHALSSAAEVSLALNANEPVLVPGAATQFNVSMMNSGDTDIEVKRLAFRGLSTDRRLDVAEKLLPATDTSRETTITTPKTTSISVPASEHLYDGRLFGERPEVDAELEIEGARFSLTTQTRMDVAPAVEIQTVAPSPYVRTAATMPLPLSFKLILTNHLATPFRGLVRINGENLETGRELILQPHETQTTTMEVRNALPVKTLRTARRMAGVVIVSIELPESKESITRRTVPTVYADARVVPDLKVGYLPSFDDTLAKALTSLGVDGKQLSVDDIQKGELAEFNTIIVDNRGYEAHPELVAANDRLLKYTQGGGTLLVFYHKTNEWNPDSDRKRPQLAPYPIILGNDRVTEEDAPIVFLQPHHPLLSFPNKITQADFTHWIQERGLYFPKDWDQHYSALLGTRDTGEQLLRGGLLVAGFGKGSYIYTSMVWYRELRAGVPGAYRAFANMISYGQAGRSRSLTQKAGNK